MMRQIQFRRRRLRQTVVMHIADNTDDLILLWIAWILIDAEFLDAFTNRILIAEENLREPLVHDCRANRATLVLIGKEPSLQQRNSDRLEVLRRNIAHVR